MKKVYEMLNDVSVDIDTYEQVSLLETEKQRLLQRFSGKQVQRRLFKKSTIAVAVAILVMVPAILNQDIVRASVVKIGKQIEFFLSKQEDSYSIYKQKMGDSVIDQGICVTLNEILLDNNNLLLSVNIKGEGDMLASGPFQPGDVEVKIDHQLYGQGTGHSLMSLGAINADGSMDYLYTKPLNEFMGTFDVNREYSIEVMFKSMEYKRHVAGESSVSRSTGSEQGLNSNPQDDMEVVNSRYSASFNEIQGEWIFNIVMSGVQVLADNHHTYPIEQMISIDEQGIKGVLQITDLRVSPIMAQIQYTFELSETVEEFSLLNVGIGLLDEQNQRLDGSNGGSQYDSTYEVNGDYYLQEGQKTLKLVPYVDADASGDLTYLYDQAVEIDLR